jgi:hypothetical protein
MFLDKGMIEVAVALRIESEKDETIRRVVSRSGLSTIKVSQSKLKTEI